MLKGLAITPPVIGRISIGKVVERNGKRLPEKDDEFTITSQIQTKDGWLAHPQDAALRKAPGAKLRSIPIRLLFNDPDLNLRVSYTMFDRAAGRPVCVGDGETCKRSTVSGIQTMPCPTPDSCEASGGHCKPFGRLNVRVGDDDELGSFVLRTTGFNSIRTLAARLQYFHAVSGGLLSTLPLELRLRGKSTTQSHRSAIYYVDITTHAGMPVTEAISLARDEAQRRVAAGFDQQALDAAARLGISNGAFEDSAEEVVVVLEEFFPEDADQTNGSAKPTMEAGAGLKDKLKLKIGQVPTKPSDFQEDEADPH